jgi:hypothetical protein
MERTQLFDLMGELKLYGMKAAFDEIMATAVKRQHEPQRIVGDLLNAAGVTWGSFMGGFNVARVNANGTSGCKRSSTGLAGTTNDYIPHHAWFQYYASTANPNHTPPASPAEIGHSGPANHGYDLEDFKGAVKAAVIEGKPMAPASIEALSKLPGRPLSSMLSAVRKNGRMVSPDTVASSSTKAEKSIAVMPRVPSSTPPST